jgi:hypothetical protein
MDSPALASSWHEFVDRHRQALECQFVRSHVHDWIDLIFGCSQRSLEKNNLFHCSAYADFEHVKDMGMHESIRQFSPGSGYCPLRLFHTPRMRSEPVQEGPL